MWVKDLEEGIEEKQGRSEGEKRVGEEEDSTESEREQEREREREGGRERERGRRKGFIGDPSVSTHLEVAMDHTHLVAVEHGL